MDGKAVGRPGETPSVRIEHWGGNKSIPGAGSGGSGPEHNILTWSGKVLGQILSRVRSGGRLGHKFILEELGGKKRVRLFGGGLFVVGRRF